MKTISKAILTTTAALSVCSIASAQHFDPEHRHSIEISAGIPPLHAQLGFDANHLRYESGIDSKRIAIPSVNLGYTFCISEMWDINAVFNYSTAIYSMSQYGIKTTAGTANADGTVREYNEYDFLGKPESSWTAVYPAYSLMADARFKWYRSESVRLYSALGVGVSYLQKPDSWLPTPYITPVGINFGKNHIYGMAELNVSSAATGLLIGCGCRF